MNGHFLREKKEYLIERFKTKSGLLDFFISSAIWAFLIINYTPQIISVIESQITFISIGMLRTYITYLVFAVISTILGMIISTIIWKVFNGKKL